MPKDRPSKLLLVETDAPLVELLVESITARLDAQLTCVASAEAALDIDLFEPHDLMISRVELPGLDGLELADRILQVRRRPVILMCEQATLELALAALRTGVSDLLPKPFDVAGLLQLVDQCLYAYRESQGMQQRYRQLRGLIRRVIRQRRELNQRVDLICRDLVGAHRRLMTRVLSTKHTAAR